ncbi:MAG: lamin tail domain-containing protein, partial [Planctomycetota bacterium]
LDGSDPRLPGGDVSPSAIRMDGASLEVTIDRTTRVLARSRVGDVWSAIMEGIYVTPSLAVTEIMYHPPEEPKVGDDPFEFIELRNISDGTFDLTGLSLEGDIRFDFSTGSITSLAPGGFVVIARNAVAFESRYGLDGRRLTGEYRGKLSNAGGPITVRGAFGETVQEFRFLDDWYPSTDGLGRSLVLRDESILPEDSSDSATWRPSSETGGSPGIVDLGGGERLPGDLTSDGAVNLTDAIFLANELFRGGGGPLPCLGSIESLSNAEMADFNGDATIDLSDVITVLLHLFRGGPAHPLGTECRAFAACEPNCP